MLARLRQPPITVLADADAPAEVTEARLSIMRVWY